MPASSPLPSHSGSEKNTSGDDVCFHLDEGLPSTAFDGCLLLRGWCYHRTDPIQGIRLVIPGVLTWPAAYGQARPDVLAAFPDSGGSHAGFELRLRLPPGDYEVRLEALAASGRVHLLTQGHPKVSKLKQLTFRLAGSARQLLRFQLLAGPCHPPRPVRTERFPTPPPGLKLPTFSIVSPSYQQAPFLEETMRSVLDQPHVNVDYVVQDGGSTDGSVGIIEQWARAQGAGKPETGNLKPEFRKRAEDPVDCGRSTVDGSDTQVSGLRSQVSPSPVSGLLPPVCRSMAFAWESAADHGQADAIARGFAKTGGGPDDLMAWLNSDDFYLPGALAHVAGYFARHPDVDVIYGHRVLVDEQSREIGRWLLPPHDDEILHLNDFVPQETLFWRRRIWERAGGINPSFRFAMDWDLLLRFQAAGARIVRLPHALACFRLHPLQKTAAEIGTTGQVEIDALRLRTFGRPIPPEEIEGNPRLLAYLRKSARMELMADLGGR